jgi:RluA family pseudouridine synthase
MTPAPVKLSSPATREFWEIPVLFEDAHLLALDKPAGLLTSPDRTAPERPSLMQLLHAGIAAGKPWATERGLTYLANAHRLEAETSGVLLLAKSKPALVTLANVFGSEKTGLRHVALVQGSPREARFEIGAKLAPHPTRPGLMRVDPKHGKRSRTVATVVENFRGCTLLDCEPLTARPHQIRAHLQNVGLPLVGDAPYGGQPLLLSQLKPGYRLKEGREERPLLARPALHAEQLTLPHPVTGESLTITAPWPKDLKVAVKYLREFAK